MDNNKGEKEKMDRAQRVRLGYIIERKAKTVVYEADHVRPK